MEDLFFLLSMPSFWVIMAAYVVAMGLIFGLASFLGKI